MLISTHLIIGKTFLIQLKYIFTHVNNLQKVLPDLQDTIYVPTDPSLHALQSYVPLIFLSKWRELCALDLYVNVVAEV